MRAVFACNREAIGVRDKYGYEMRCIYVSEGVVGAIWVIILGGSARVYKPHATWPEKPGFVQCHGPNLMVGVGGGSGFPRMLGYLASNE